MRDSWMCKNCTFSGIGSALIHTTMSYTLQNAKDDLAGQIHGRSVSKVTNPDSAARRAGYKVLTQVDPEETKRFAQITLYDGVEDYALPMTDLKDKKIFDVRPQVNRSKNDNLSSRFSKDFDLKKQDNWLSVEYSDGTEFIRISKRLSPSSASIDAMDRVGSWLASGDASNLAVDNLYSVSDGSSLKFDLANAGSSGLVTNSAVTTRDLSDGEGSYAFFLWVYLPVSSTDITGVNLRFGSSPTSYWESTGTIHFGSQRQGWNLFRFDWPAGAGTGSPDSSAIDYIRIEITYGGTAVTGIRIDRLFASLPRIWTIGYYSSFIFKNGTTWSDVPNDDNATLNLGTTSFLLFEYEYALAALQQIQGKDAAADRSFFFKELYGDGQNSRGMYVEYRKNNPSQAEKVTQTWYTNTRFRRK